MKAVLVDVDETLTTRGKLTADAYAALEKLHRAGRIVVPEVGVEPTHLLRAADFRATSAFAAPEDSEFVVWSTPSP